MNQPRQTLINFTKQPELALVAFLLEGGVIKFLMLFCGTFVVGTGALFIVCQLASFMTPFIAVALAAQLALIFLALGVIALLCSDQKLDSKIVQPIIKRLRAKLPTMECQTDQLFEMLEELKVVVTSIFLLVSTPPPRLHLT